MPEDSEVSGTVRRPCRALPAMAAAAICLGLSAVPAGAQFEFLFGGRPEPPPPPAAAKPADTPAGQTKPAKVKPRKPKPAVAKTAPEAKPPAVAVEEPPPPYDPALLRLAEILGALTYLEELCATKPSGDWRVKMQAILEAEAKSKMRKERLAGSYNRGFRDYERTYHLCTSNAQAVIGLFLAEGGRLAHDVVSRYGGS